MRNIFNNLTILYIVLLGICSSCDKQLSRSLEFAGDNRAEMEKVLAHFENDPNPIKYKAARFMIENMRYHYSYMGKSVEEYDSLYVKCSKMSAHDRGGFFDQSYAGIDFSNCNIYIDIEHVKADYLIKAIDEACDLWCGSDWSDEYDESIFFDYVLPYRLANERISDWRGCISEQFPLLAKDVVISRRGVQYEAEDAKCLLCESVALVSASKGGAESLSCRGSSVTFLVKTEKDTEKYLIAKYATICADASIHVSINGKAVDSISLSQSRNLQTFVEKWDTKPLCLRKGENVITVSTTADTLVLDYIQLAAVEQYSKDDLVDLSQCYYQICNSQTQSCIVFDTLQSSRQNPVRLMPSDVKDSTQFVCLDYQGYPVWSICSSDAHDGLCIEVKFGRPSSLSPDSLITQANFENRPFQQWVFFRAGKDCYRIMNKFNGMFLESKKDDATGTEYLVQNPYSEKEAQKWVLKERGMRPSRDSFFKMGSSFSEALRVFDVMHLFQYFMHSGHITPQATTLFQTKTGKCADETNYTVYLCRYLGIPAACDFTPNWGNRSQGHSWSVLIKPDGKSVPFYMGNMPGDTVHYFHTYKKPKVFRNRFSANKEYAADLRNESEVPDLFSRLNFVDVSDEYFPTTDVERNIPDSCNDKRIAYICVFDNEKWVPVHYGKIKNGKTVFRAMGRGIVYMSVFYEHGSVIPFGNPFLVTDEGAVMDIEADTCKTQTMTLMRKYPFLGKHDFFNSRMSGGEFQGSNDEAFANAMVLHTHQGITDGNWYDIPVNDENTYRFLRYIGPKGSYCNINELEFYDEKGNKIQGEIIGTEGESWARKENVFDGDILTGFGANSPDGNWVGIKLKTPARIKRLRYIGRNDGNSVEAGDIYAFSIWLDRGWKVLAIKRAESNFLRLEKMPQGGLYKLSDLTKGKEERIFTYENGEQVWW